MSLPSSRAYAIMTAEVQVPFKFTIIHGGDPSLRSSPQKAMTRSLNLMGLVFECQAMDADGFHLSFTESAYGRNSLEITLDLGKKFGEVELLGQVEWYERRSTAIGFNFIVGVSFVDVQADELTALRDFLQQLQTLKK
jgi:hypothetical protein